MNRQFEKLLMPGDLRSVGKINRILAKVRGQAEFDELFAFLFHKERRIVMRAADAIEKLSERRPAYLLQHKNEILELCDTAENKELKWHLALLIPRLALSTQEMGYAIRLLTKWAIDKDESRIVRVNSIQALYQISRRNKVLVKPFEKLLATISQEEIPSINARIRKFAKLAL